MAVNEEQLLRTLRSSVEDLRKRIERRFDCIDKFLENMPDNAASGVMFDSYPSRSREHVLINAIREAIETLEMTRKAFKSKTLETLRKKLTQVLIELK